MTPVNDPPVVLWRGFRHQWRYNHAPLRLGSRVLHDRRDPASQLTHYRVQHAGAAAGHDTLTQRDRFTEIQARGVFAITRSLHLELPAGGGSTSTDLKIPLPEGFDPTRGEALAFLNGFDLSWEPAGLQHFRLAIEDLEGNDFQQDGEWVGKVRGEWQPTSTAEEKAGARLAVELLVFFFDPKAMRIEPAGTCHLEYGWDLDTPVEREDRGIQTVLFEGPELWPRSRAEIALGFRAFSLTLRAEGPDASTEALRFLEWDLGVRRLRWQEEAVRAELEMFFKNWRPGMDNAQPPDSRQSVRQAGIAELTSDPVLLQLDRDATTFCEHRQAIASEPSAQDPSQPLREETFEISGR